MAEQLAALRSKEGLELLSLKATELAAAVRQMQNEMRSANVSGEGEAAGAAAGAQRQRLSALCLELLSVRVERDEQECAERLLSRRMLRHWHAIKEERRAQGFTATRAKLQVQLLEADEEADEVELDEACEAEVHERQLMSTLARAVGGAATAGVAAFDARVAREEVRARQASLRRASGEKSLLPIYAEHDDPTPLELLTPQAPQYVEP